MKKKTQPMVLPPTSSVGNPPSKINGTLVVESSTAKVTKRIESSEDAAPKYASFVKKN